MEVNANGLLPPPEVEGEEAISHSTAWVGAVKVGITGPECPEVDARKTCVGVGALRVNKGQFQTVGQRHTQQKTPNLGSIRNTGVCYQRRSRDA